MNEKSEIFSNCEKDAVKLLTRKDYSKFKLAQKLEEKGHDANLINDVIEDLRGRKLFREDWYIEARIRGLIRKHYGPEVISLKLQQEEIYVNETEILDIYQEVEITQEDQIRNLVQKKYSHIDNIDFNTKQKILRFLHSKGHYLENLSKYLD